MTGKPTGAAFQLAQIGYHASSRFEERLKSLGLNPPQAGLLRAIATQPGRSQRAIAEELGVYQPHLVAMIDELEGDGLVERQVNPLDRRERSLHLTAGGEQTMRLLSDLAREHEREIVEPLNREEQKELSRLLRSIADAHGLKPRVHPGYRDL